MSCKFCFKVRRTVGRIAGAIRPPRFEYNYLKEFRERFPQRGRMIYVLDMMMVDGWINPQHERFIYIDPAREGMIHKLRNKAQPYDFAVSALGGSMAVTEVHAIADLSTGIVIKNRTGSADSFEDFFYFYFGSMNNLTEKYYSYLRRQREIELA